MGRLKKLTKSLKKYNLDGFFIFSPVNRFYLTGFKSSYGFLVVTRTGARLYLDSRYYEAGKAMVKDAEVKKFSTSSEFRSSISSYLNKKNIKRLGFEEERLVFSMFKMYSDLFKSVELVPAEVLIQKLRITKESFEIKMIEKAVEISGKAFNHILNFIKPGMMEKDLEAELEYTIKRYGGEAASFDIIFLGGPKSSMPHGVPGKNKIRDKDIVLIDFGVRYRGYISDITRTFFIGTPDKKLKKIYNIVLKAQKAAVKAAKPGLTCNDLDKVARDIISKARYGKYFGHGLGHGIGLEVHEPPRVSRGITEPLKRGMTITIEPGIYIPGLGGVRIEDDIKITSRGARNLSESIPKELIIL